MNRQFIFLTLSAALGVGMLPLQAQQAAGQTPGRQPPPTADPYANNAAAGTLKFPLAAPAGKDSGAITTPLPNSVNQGAIDEKSWKYGHAFDATADGKIWNPVKLKMMRGEKVTGGTFFASSDPTTYCAFANAGYDFVWTEMQHNTRTWSDVAKMWQACPHAKAVPGVRVAYADEREIQHALDAGALVIVIPTVRTVEEGKAGRDWTYFPPLGKRSLGGGQAFSPDFWGSVPGGYRNTINDNVVLIEMIETIGGAAQAREIAAIPGVDAVFAASGDLGNFSGFKQGEPDYERLINVVHDAALAAGKRLCGPLAWRDRPDFTCFQAGSETAAIARGVAAELGPLKDTQGKPEIGPYAPKK
ncbi:MAG TPA: aldolase/citrate lyase family protein [Bryobacteraceae bacterium]|nr:aldolase/citrate lyase family protein [Bryobacteraceae bacterium]